MLSLQADSGDVCVYQGAIFPQTASGSGQCDIIKNNWPDTKCCSGPDYNPQRLGQELENNRSFYNRFVKRFFDAVSSFMFILFFWWLLVLIAVRVKRELGSPVLFRQPRPGEVDPATGEEKIFEMLKFRTMSDERDENGELLPNEQRINEFGRKLRATSLDELPEIFNILKGDMSVIGPRPQLVKDMVFMTDEQRLRHTVKPGLTGLAQVMGRNAISWEEKMDFDLQYVKSISFKEDIRIFWMTVEKVVLRKSSDIPNVEIDFTPDLGDDLLLKGEISKDEYDMKQEEAKRLIDAFYSKKR